MTDRLNLSYARRLVVLCLAVHFIFSLVGWDHSILDHHGFRQTQTAISSYYFIKDGYRLAYETPVFGVPWSIPLEFPLYQAIVACLSQHTGWPLDQTGRAVSLLFFYALLLVLYQLITRITGDRICGYLAVAVTLVSPTYLLWSRAFLMESTALFFCLLYLWGIAGFLEHGRRWWVVLALLAGIVGGIVKITTFSFALALGGMLCLMWWLQKKGQMFSGKVLREVILMVIFFAAIPMATALKWTAFADTVKFHNPLGQKLSSKGLMTWNFGTLQQRLTGQFHHIPVLVLAAGAAFIFFVLFQLAQRQRRNFIMLFITFLIAPLVFTNLFLRHGYYWYENTAYLTAALGIVLGALMTRPAIAPLVRRILIPGGFALMWLVYAGVVLKGEIHDAGQPMVASAQMIGKYTTDNGVLFCYGIGFDPTVPYYARRKAIMLDDGDLNKPAVNTVLSNTGPQNIQALVVGASITGEDERIAAIARQFHLMRELALPDKDLRVFVRI